YTPAQQHLQGVGIDIASFFIVDEGTQGKTFPGDGVGNAQQEVRIGVSNFALFQLREHSSGSRVNQRSSFFSSGAYGAPQDAIRLTGFYHRRHTAANQVPDVKPVQNFYNSKHFVSVACK